MGKNKGKCLKEKGGREVKEKRTECREEQEKTVKARRYVT